MTANELEETFPRVNSEVTAMAGPAGTADVLTWLGGQVEGQDSARDAGLTTLLATTHGAVVWGRKENNGWKLSNREAKLSADDLIDLRAFGPDAEVFVWRDATGLRARRRADGAGKACDTLAETQLLWGTEIDPDGKKVDGFTPLRDGEQGLRHAPPLAPDESYFVKERDDEGKRDKRYGHRPARLVLRHYIAEDNATGLARIVDTRLVEVKAEPPPKATRRTSKAEEEANQDESPA